MNNIKPFITAFFLCVILAGLFPGSGLYPAEPVVNPETRSGDSVVIPGKVEDFIFYLRYHALDEHRIVFHLNEILLFDQLPDLDDMRRQLIKKMSNPNKWRKAMLYARDYHKRMIKRTLTWRIKTIFTSHRGLGVLLRLHGGRLGNRVSLSMDDPKQKETAINAAKLLGIDVCPGVKKRFRLVEYYAAPDYLLNQYYFILGINPVDMERNLNQTGKLEFEISQFNATLPQPIEFFRKVTGLNLTKENFIETLVDNRDLQLLAGILYRLSHKEFDFISQLGSEPGVRAWKTIYRNNRLLRGFFLLSHGLRVKNNTLDVPGGPGKLPFWEKIVGVNYKKYPFEFLKQLAIKHYGKLNYFYVFSYFLPPEKQDALLFQLDGPAFREVYNTVQLKKEERIEQINVPSINKYGFFLLMYALDTENGSVVFPGGIEAWANVLKVREKNLADILKKLLSPRTKKDVLPRFIAIYSKFRHRPELLTPRVLKLMFDNFWDYNILLDYVERLPIKKPGTVENLYKFVFKLEKSSLKSKDKQAITGIFQSLLTLIANRAEIMPREYDYEALVDELARMQLQPGMYYDQVFRFLEEDLGIDMERDKVDQSFLDFLTPPGEPAAHRMVYQEQTLKIDAKTLFQKQYSRILKSQETPAMSSLVRLNDLLRQFRAGTAVYKHQYVVDAFSQLPVPEDEDIEPPKDERPRPFRGGPSHRGSNPSYRRYLFPYSGSWLFKNIERLVKENSRDNKKPNKKIAKITREIKGKCLLHELKHLLVTSVYAATLKNSNMKMFLNPNLTRYHNFFPGKRLSPWNHCGMSEDHGGGKVFRMSGGLSRIHIALSFVYSDHLFGREEFGEYSNQGISLVYNNTRLFPLADTGLAQEYTGLMVKLGEEFLEQSKNDSQLREELHDVVSKIVAGNHYRRVTNILSAESQPSGQKKPERTAYFTDQLYYSEILRIGEYFFDNKKFLHRFSRIKELEKFNDPGVLKTARQHMDRLGSVYYYTFGSLKPQRRAMFPQPLSLLFKARWISAEMIDELKIKAAFISYVKKMPPQLIGSLIFRFIHDTAADFAQNFGNDYHKTFYLYSQYNYLYMNRIFKRLKRTGLVVF